MFTKVEEQMLALNNELMLQHMSNLINFELENERIIYGKCYLTATEMFNKIFNIKGDDNNG